MNDITPDTFPTLQKVNPLDGLPTYLKDPKNYSKVQKALLETMHCGKSHADPSEVFHCSKCTSNMQERRALMKKFGFRDAKQYMAWKKVHEEVKARMPLDKYNSIINES